MSGAMQDRGRDDDRAPDEHGPLRPVRWTTASPLAITVDSPRRGVCVVAVAGELDLATADQLAAALHPVLAGDRVVLDLSAVTFLASRGLGVLLDAHQRAGGRLRVIVAHPPVRRVLEISGVVAVLRCHHSLGDALAAI